MRPVMAESRHNVSHHITSSDSPIYIGNYYFCPIVPQENLASNCLFTLQPTFYSKSDRVLSRLQI